MKSSPVQFRKRFLPKKFFEEVCKTTFPTKNSGYFLGWNRDWEVRGGLTFYILQISELIVFSIVSIYDKMFKWESTFLGSEFLYNPPMVDT